MKKVFFELMAFLNIGMNKLNECFIKLERELIDRNIHYVTDFHGPIILENGCIIDVVAKRIQYLKNYRIIYKIHDHNRKLINQIDLCRDISTSDLKKISDLIVRTGFGFWYTHANIPGTNKFYEFLIAYDTGTVLYRMGEISSDGIAEWTEFREFKIREKRVSSFHPILSSNGNIIIYYRLGSEDMYYQVGKIVNRKIYFDNSNKFELPILESTIILLKNHIVLCYSGHEYCFGIINKNYDIKWSNKIQEFNSDYVKELIYFSDSDLLLKLDFENSIETYLIDYSSQKINGTELKIKINSHFNRPKLVKINDERVFILEIDKPNPREYGYYCYAFEKISNISSDFILHQVNNCA